MLIKIHIYKYMEKFMRYNLKRETDLLKYHLDDK